MASEYILEMNNITKEFPGVKALDDVNLKVNVVKSMHFVEKTELVNLLL